MDQAESCKGEQNIQDYRRPDIDEQSHQWCQEDVIEKLVIEVGLKSDDGEKMLTFEA